jgi:long-chain acyl-CoA synthetase
MSAAQQHLDARPWLSLYPDGVPSEVDSSTYGTLSEVLEESFARYPSRIAISFKGTDFMYSTIDKGSRQLAAHLQGNGLSKGDRVAVMLPNIPQYAVAMAGILRAGLVLVNVNPLYTPRELEHQLKDSGARAIVFLDRFEPVLAQCIDNTAIEFALACSIGEPLTAIEPAPAKLEYASCATRRKLPFQLALVNGSALPLQPGLVNQDDLAVLQYTGGTTGVSKGAMLLHRNLIANVLQSEHWFAPALGRIPEGEILTAACMLPLYHVFAFVVNMLLVMRAGGRNILVLDPRNPGAALDDLKPYKIHFVPGLSTLFSGLMAHPDFAAMDWTHLKATVAGGMPTLPAVARRWKEVTGCAVCEGYGLTETAASVTCNPIVGDVRDGTIGIPLPSTRLVLLDEEGVPCGPGTVGQIAVKGPQVMAGYWRNEEETRRFVNAEGYFFTGDLGTMDAEGFFRIVDRQKDMILVSGFNVYPSEVEAVVTEVAGVIECAAVSIDDSLSGEAVKLVVVTKDKSVTEEAILDYCRLHLTGYKRPKLIEFRDALPKTPVGKILRRALRDSANKPGTEQQI